MREVRNAFVCCLFLTASTALAQILEVKPQVRTSAEIDSSVTVIEVAAHFVTAIRMPETVNSVVVGDPALFQVEHSEREPQLVFIKALTTKAVESNLLIATARGHEASLLLVSRGEQKSATPARVDFLLKYKTAGGFLIEPDYPSVLVGQTMPLDSASPGGGSTAFDRAKATPASMTKSDSPSSALPDPRAEKTAGNLDNLLARQQRAPLPTLYGEHVAGETANGDQVRAGVSEVLDGGERVIVLFSAVNPTEHNILLMPPQVQLGGKTSSGKVIRRSHWTTADQLPVAEFRLSKRRLGPGERADGVVVFERPPYKQSNETMFLQMAEAGAVDRSALAPIGFGISTGREETHHGEHATGQ